jgi:hypothetical protein
MNLPRNEIGITDVLEWRRCPARFAYGMRRHVELPKELQLEPGEKDNPTEATNENNAYGSCIHDAIGIVEREAVTDEEAISRAFPRYARWLNPEDADLLREDLKTYHRRRPLGVTLVASERDLRVPLFVHNGVQIYFRFKVDVLHRLISNPAVFVMRDYKSSKWRKTDEEIHSDLQQWAYNFGVHEFYPECERLIQVYDQLRYGETPTSKNAEQRAQMKAWLIDCVTAILNDDQLKPTANQFCRFCPMVVTCRETRRLTREWRARLAIMAPMSQDGRKLKVAFDEDAEELERIVRDDLPRMIEARKHLEYVEKALKEIVEQMPLAEREAAGWAVRERHVKSIAPEGLRELHDYMGDEFYRLVGLSMTRLEDTVGRPKKGEPLAPELKIARSWQLDQVGTTYVVPANTGNGAG